MLDTRTFWFEEQFPFDPKWQESLQIYQASKGPWPFTPLPSQRDYQHVLHTNDSAPGPDGLPYAAWRAFSHLTADLLLHDLMYQTTD